MTTTTTSRPRQSVTCPDWCTAPDEHLYHHFVTDVVHRGPRSDGLVVPSDAEVPMRLLQAELVAWTEQDGSPEPPHVSLLPLGDGLAGGGELDADGLRRLVARVRAHATELEALADRLEVAVRR